jgi:hypothetical protein
LCNHTCTQTIKGVRIFIQCTKPKKIVILERGWKLLQALSAHA